MSRMKTLAATAIACGAVLSPATAIAAPQASSVPSAHMATRAVKSDVVTPRAGAVNIRNYPGTSGKIVAVLYPGMYVREVGSAGKWWIVQLKNGSYAYISTNNVRFTSVVCTASNCI